MNMRNSQLDISSNNEIRLAKVKYLSNAPTMIFLDIDTENSTTKCMWFSDTKFFGKTRI